MMFTVVSVVNLHSIIHNNDADHDGRAEIDQEW